MPTLADIAGLLNQPVPPDAEREITGLATLMDAVDGDLSFLGSEKYLPQFRATKATAVLVSKKVKLDGTSPTAVFIVDDADLAAAKILEHFAPPVPKPAAGIDPTAKIDPAAVVGKGAHIGPHVCVGAGTTIGTGVVLHPGVVIGDDVTLGDDCVLHANVVIRERVSIGSRVTINAGSMIGTDGFGYRWDGTRHVKIPQIGTVIIENDVELGSCVCIDRAKTGATRVGRGSKIDNLVQIAHNVVVGEHCIIAGQAGIAGSTRLGTGVILGGQSAVRDHIALADGSMVAACSAVSEDTAPKSIVSGVPALPHRQSLREQGALRKLPDLIVQMRKLRDELDELKKAIQAK